MSQVKILLVDDHEIFLEGLANLLSTVSELEIVGTATNGYEALDLLEQGVPDILMTDLSMPEMGGIELVKKVKSLYSDLKVLVLTMHNDRPTISEIIMAEAEGYLLKNTSKKELVKAINRVHDGGTYYSNEVMSVLLEKVKAEHRQMEAKGVLTERELEILHLISEEKPSKEIADLLNISIMTVDTHRKNLLKKTKTSSVVGLLKYGIHHQLITV